MTTVQSQPSPAPSAMPEVRTMAELLEHLDGIPPERIRLRPAPGTATEQDVLNADDEDRLCELVDGVLVEKPMGIEESLLAAELIFRITSFVRAHKLGIVTAPDGTIRLAPGLVRLPDVAFFSWDRLPGRRAPKVPIPAIYPDLAIEVLSASNTKREMNRKLREYFVAGTPLVWYVDPPSRTVAVYTTIGEPAMLTEADVLDGGTVLPGFKLPLRELFAVLEQTADGGAGGSLPMP